MPFTTHGYKVPGLPEEGTDKGKNSLCGGPGLCVKCSVEAGNILRASIANHVEDPHDKFGH